MFFVYWGGGPPPLLMVDRIDDFKYGENGYVKVTKH
ncbi:3-hydroxyacyl-ACP dehydratase FabZ family protein, partial [Enterobacter sichuanensis]